MTACRAGGRKKKNAERNVRLRVDGKLSRVWFRSRDLWVMALHANYCATTDDSRAQVCSEDERQQAFSHVECIGLFLVGMRHFEEEYNHFEQRKWIESSAAGKKLKSQRPTNNSVPAACAASRIHSTCM